MAQVNGAGQEAAGTARLELPGDPVAARLVAAREADRRQLAARLHDEVVQTLVNLALHLQLCERALDADLERGKDELRGARAAVGDAISRLRGQVYELRPQVLEEAGVAATLRRYAQTLPGHEERPLEVADGLDGRRLPPSVELGLFRVGQAALANAYAHAGASRVLVALGASGGRVTLEVRDDGRGFDAEAARATGGGSGLHQMSDWADALGASLAVESGPAGTVVRLEAPIP